VPSLDREKEEGKRSSYQEGAYSEATKEKERVEKKGVFTGFSEVLLSCRRKKEGMKLRHGQRKKKRTVEKGAYSVQK